MHVGQKCELWVMKREKKKIKSELKAVRSSGEEKETACMSKFVSGSGILLTWQYSFLSVSLFIPAVSLAL